MEKILLQDQVGGVVTFTLNMPETGNAISNRKLCDALIEAFEKVNADLTVRCVILTGQGKIFCSGGNIKDIQSQQGIFNGDPLTVKENYRASVQKLAKTVWECEVPVIAAVNGPAYGAGCDLALMADIRIAAPEAKFAENFVQLGLIPGDGGSWFLPRQIGLSKAAEMTFTADPVNAATALQWGLVSSVAPAGEVVTQAEKMAARIARHPPRQLRLSKKLLREGLSLRLDTILELAGSYQGIAHQTEDHKEGIAALIEKRAPVFKGE